MRDQANIAGRVFNNTRVEIVEWEVTHGNMTPKNDFPYAGSQAAEMLAEAIHRRQLEGISLRRTAGELGYRQAVVLSHMLTGRVLIPVERVPQLAKHLGMDEHAFLLAVLEQRFPEVRWSKHMQPAGGKPRPAFVEMLEKIAGTDLDALTEEQKRVMREVAADLRAGRRWLSVHEVAAIELLREHIPTVSTDGPPDWLKELLSM